MDSNRRTLASYVKHVSEYLAGTETILAGPEKAWIDSGLEQLEPGARILEIGSGPGRDATYIEQRGYEVKCTDASVAFVEYLRGQGIAAQVLNVLSDPSPTGFDLILANSVLLHFSRDELGTVLGKLAEALAAGSLCAFSLKRGDGEEWSDHKLNAPRFFCYWQSESLAVQGRATGQIGMPFPDAVAGQLRDLEVAQLGQDQRGGA
jgi:SAM-dependent methyltransferase